MNHIAFPSITQFKQIVKQVRDTAKYHGTPLPTIKFRGTTKLHGSNAAVCQPLCGDMYAQSRERVLDLIHDNAGFCAFMLQNKTQFDSIMEKIENLYPHTPGTIQLFGEWCGGNIQKGVGLSKLPKMFVVFAIRISEDAASQDWFTKEQICNVMQGMTTDTIKCIYDFPHWEIDIPFSNPESVQNLLVEMTVAVESKCPVASALLPDSDDELIGEGIVWSAVSSNPMTDIAGLIFKVKGEKHSVSKVKTLAEVDEVKLASVDEFVEMAVTENRMNQGIDVLKQRGVECDPKNTGKFISWLMEDVLKEESGAMVNSGLCVKDVQGKICSKAREFWLNLI